MGVVWAVRVIYLEELRLVGKGMGVRVQEHHWPEELLCLLSVSHNVLKVIKYLKTYNVLFSFVM